MQQLMSCSHFYINLVILCLNINQISVYLQFLSNDLGYFPNALIIFCLSLVFDLKLSTLIYMHVCLLFCI